MAGVAWQEQAPDLGFRWGRLGSDYVGEWVGILVLRCRADGSSRTVTPDPKAPAALVEKVTSGAAAAFVRSLQGRFSLHASAVAIGARCVALTGASGAGKSTLASVLCAKFGAALMADDIAALDLGQGRVRIEPTESVVWVDDGTGTKAPFAPTCTTRPRDLSLLVSLRFNDALDEPMIREVRGSQTVACVLDALLRFHPHPELWTSEFALIERLARQVPVLELERSHRVSADRTAEFLMRTLHQVGKPGELASVAQEGRTG